jgi:hypothetical protein
VYGAQGITVSTAVHAPEPLHAVVLCWPTEHDVAHTVPDGQSRQRPPLHLPSVPQLDAAVTAHSPRGSVVPFEATPHVPFAPPVSAAAHAWHAAAHAVLQQNPSTQKPLTH